MQYDLFASRQAKEEAIARVEAHNSDWVADSMSAIQSVARQKEYFTTDDVWPLLDSHNVEPRAMGASMRRAMKERIVEATGSWRQSANPTCHARPKKVWRSLIKENQ